MACIAMLTSQSLQDIKNFVFKRKLISSKFSYASYGVEAKAILNRMGVKCRFVKYKGLDKLTRHSIVFVISFDNDRGSHHAVVWDVTRKCIVDPSDILDKRLSYHNAYMCLEIVA